MNETLLKIVAISSLIEGAVLATASYLYWGAYKEMNYSPIIGWVAKATTAGAVVGLIACFKNLFPNNIFLGLLVTSRVVLSYTVLMFIKASLTPEGKGLKSLGKPAKTEKKS